MSERSRCRIQIIFREEDPVELAASVDVAPRWVWPGAVLYYTFVVSNVVPFAPATGVVLSDVLPLGTTLAWASGDYTHTGDEVAWNLGTVAPGQRVSVTLAVTVAVSLSEGTPILNAHYGAWGDQVLAAVVGPPAWALVPWQFFLPVVLRGWP